MNPGGTVTTAATRPEASWLLGLALATSATISTFFATSLIRRSMLNDAPPTVTTCGIPSRSTNATRGFAFAYAAVSPISSAITSG